MMTACKKTRKTPVWFLLTLCLCLLSTAVIPVSVSAASNKVLKVSKLSFANKTAENRFRGAEIMATPLETDKLTKKTMKLSGKIWIPVKALRKAGDEIMISPELALWKFPPTGENNNAGIIYPKYDILLSLKEDGAIALYKINDATNKRSKIGNYATVKKDGAYYLVAVKNIPVSGIALDEKDERTSINTKKEFILNPGFGIFSTTKKAWKGTVLVDDIKLKTASKTQTITFDKKDFEGTFATNWASGNPKASVTKK